VITIQKPVCGNEQIRRSMVALSPSVNGIDYLNVDPADHTRLQIVFLKPVGPRNPADPNDTNDEFGLSTDLSKIVISGGTRIVGIKPKSATRNPDGSITVVVDQAGDFSTYTLALDVPQLDVLFNEIDFSFMATCPVDFDCRTTTVCPPAQLAELLLDYEAKDYASFRQLLLDLLPQLNPKFIETNPSDLGIALVELLAYTGDRLSYFQDAVANEAYLDTLRQRISARRLAKLVDYQMHSGRNAWAYVHFAVDAIVNPLPLGTKIVSRIGAPLSGATTPPGVIVDTGKITAETLQTDPALSSAVVFETTLDGNLNPVNNLIYLHTWGNEECCIARGTTEAYVYAAQLDSISGKLTAILPVLHANDWLLIEEVLGVDTGLAADANPSHRQVVKLDQEPDSSFSDAFFSNLLLPGGAVQKRVAGDQPLPLLHVHWGAIDQVQSQFCISTKLSTGVQVVNISVARGNIVLADQGLTLQESIVLSAPVPDSPPFRPRLSFAPLTMQMQPAQVDYDIATGRLTTPRTDLTGDVTQAVPAVSLLVSFPSHQDLWRPVSDLLESSPFDTEFVPELDNDEAAVLRFGDDEYGMSIAGATAISATYRIGNAVSGNVGAEALAHLAVTLPFSGVTLVRNPLPAQNGVDPESIADVQQWAPEAFRAVQFRAVTEADYVNAAQLLPQVQSAVASFRWTGSWYTVFIGILPSSPSDLINQAKGLMQLSSGLQQTVLNFLDGYRLAGYDLEIRPPQFLPLEIDLLLCVSTDYFRSDVTQAVKAALSDQILADGSKGFFFLGNFVFGQPVYLSQVYAVIQAVEGVDSVVVTRFTPFGQPDNGELAQGLIPVGPWQIARLDNDPNFMERGVLKIDARGGKL
jgi:hypothetical protein